MIPRYAIGAKEHYRNGEFWCADVAAEPHDEGDWVRWSDVSAALEHVRAQVARVKTLLDDWDATSHQRSQYPDPYSQRLRAIVSTPPTPPGKD